MRTRLFLGATLAFVSLLTIQTGSVRSASSGTSVTGVTPSVVPSGPGLAASFTVSFTSSAPGAGLVSFGPSCNALIYTGADDVGAGTTSHTVNVSGNDMEQWALGGAAVLPGVTYFFAVVTSTSSGSQVDNNGGACYQVTLPSTAQAATFITSQSTQFGPVLFTSGGRALYMRSFDASSGPSVPLQSTCTYTDNCAAAWPPLLASSPTGPFNVGGGVDASHLGTVARTDAQGNTVYQVTYFGWPLYLFVRDTAPGNINGENVTAFNAFWHLMATSGQPQAGTATVNLESSAVGSVLSARVAFGATRSLYVLSFDPAGTVTCTGPCAGIWPPLLTSGPPIAGSGVTASGLGTATLPDGTQQVTYFGHPLYLFAFDLAPGAASGLTNGEYYVDPSAKGYWTLLSPSGTPNPGPLSIGSMSASMGSILAVNPPSTFAPRPIAVYAFSTDTATNSSCTSTCARFWPPVIVSGTPTADTGSGVDATHLGTITRPDGTLQATYFGHPLYFFVNDIQNTTNGEGKTAFGGTFQVVTVAGAPT